MYPDAYALSRVRARLFPGAVSRRTPIERRRLLVVGAVCPEPPVPAWQNAGSAISPPRSLPPGRVMRGRRIPIPLLSLDGLGDRCRV